MGCVVGRYANRIAKGKFSIDGHNFCLAVNNGPNALHGGMKGFDKKLWDFEIFECGVMFSLHSKDGDEGYPGDLDITVTYKLIAAELSVQYKATTSKATPINITNHSYFNLSGHKSWDSDLSHHEITLNSDKYLPADEHCLVTGEIKPCSGTLYDLRKPTKLSKEILEKIPGGGYDHTYCLPLNGQRFMAATLRHETNGRVMRVETTAPGVQLYTANYLSGEEGKQQVKYHRHTALCLETQNWPDAVNHPTSFPNCVLRPGEEYNHQTWFTFSA